MIVLRWLTALTTLCFLSACSPKVALPSLKEGSDKFVNCIFDASSVYKDIVFEFKYDKRKNAAQLVFKKPENEFRTRVIAHTENRLSVAFLNNRGTEVLLNLFYDTGLFTMLDQNVEIKGKCDEML